MYKKIQYQLKEWLRQTRFHLLECHSVRVHLEVAQH